MKLEQGALVVKRTQDVEPILRANKAMQTSGHDGFNADRTWKWVASIPNVVVEQWMKEGINIYKPEALPKLKAKLNSKEFEFFRTYPGKL